jgi:hypothetical protein
MWEPDLVDEAIATAEARLHDETVESRRAAKRQVQLAREQGYHRLATAIDRPSVRNTPGGGQLSLFPSDPTLLDD